MEEEKLLSAIRNENIEEIKSILKNSIENKKILNLNNIKDEYGQYPLLIAIRHSSNIELIELLIEYAEQHHIILEVNEKDNVKEDYPLLSAISKDNNVEIIKLLIDYSNRHQLILKLNEKNRWEEYPLLLAISSNNNIEIVKLLVEYAIEHQINLEYDIKKNEGNSEIINLLNNYEIKKIEKELREKRNLEKKKWKKEVEKKLEKEMEIKFNNKKLEWEKNLKEKLKKEMEIKFNHEKLEWEQEKSKKEQHMRERLENEILKNKCIEKKGTEEELLKNIINDDFKKVKAILKKYETNNIILDINKKDNDGNSLMYYATRNNNIKIVKSLIKYAEHHNIIIRVNDGNKEGMYSFLNATLNNNIEMVKLLLDYSNENEIIININKQNSNKNYPLDNAVYHNNIEMVKLLIKYADNNNIILDINQKDDIGNSPIINAVSNIEMIQLFIEYSNRKNIILNINQQNDYDNYLLDLIIKNNNIEIFNIFINYANNRNIDLNLNEKYIESYISKLNNNILVELKKYYQKGRIKVGFKEDSELKKILVDENEYLIKDTNNYLKKNKNEEIQTENPIDFEKLNVIANNSVFRIEYNIDNKPLKSGTGFFVKLPIPSEKEQMYGLMTCYHNLKSKLIQDFKFKIYLKNKEKEIKLNESHFNGTYIIYTSPLIDITFIQLSNDLIAELGLKKNEHFLIPCNNDKNIFNKLIYSFQYPNGGDCKFAAGNVKSISDIDSFHNVPTDEGSSGAPLINNNYEVIAVHKSKNKDKNLNIATKFKIIQDEILKLYNNKYIKNIDKSGFSPKKLTSKEINELEKHGLQKKSKYIFTLPKFDNYPQLNFCRLIHGWYWTKDISEIKSITNKGNIFKYLRQYNWNIVKFMEDNHPEYKGISHQQKDIILFLKKSKLKYLCDCKL